MQAILVSCEADFAVRGSICRPLRRIWFRLNVLLGCRFFGFSLANSVSRKLLPLLSEIILHSSLIVGNFRSLLFRDLFKLHVILGLFALGYSGFLSRGFHSVLHRIILAIRLGAFIKNAVVLIGEGMVGV